MTSLGREACSCSLLYFQDVLTGGPVHTLLCLDFSFGNVKGQRNLWDHANDEDDADGADEHEAKIDAQSDPAVAI